MKTRSAKNKGARLQNFIRDVFRKLFSDELEDGDVEARTMGNAGTDIILSPLAKKKIPFDIECKNTERLNLNESLKQCIVNTSKDRVPLLVFTKNKEDVYISMKFVDFIKLLYPTKNFELSGKMKISEDSEK